MSQYDVRSQIPDVDTYIRVRLQAGLSEKTIEAATKGLANSLFGITTYVGCEPVGIGRVIGDGSCFFEIADIAVVPEHQGQGLGRRIMEAFMVWVHEHVPKSAYVSLMADHGTQAFYQKFGFQLAELPKSAGMFLRIR